MAVQTFEDLKVWQRSCQLATDVCVWLAPVTFYSLRNQAERSAISVASNIAEGSERDSPKDFIRFLRIAKGSCSELRTQLYLFKKLSVQLSEPSWEPPEGFIDETKEINAMLQGLIRSLEAKIQNPRSTEN